MRPRSEASADDAANTHVTLEGPNSAGTSLIQRIAAGSTPAEPPPLRIASPADTSFVLDLQKRWTNALGFLPTAAIDWYISNGRVLLSDDNGDNAGYLLGRSSLRCQPHVQPITQAAVAFDAQRRSHGLRLVEGLATAAAAAGRQILQCWCRVDLDANAFWRAAGFVPIGIRRPHNVRGQPLILWRRPIATITAETLVTLPTLAGYQAKTADRMRHLTTADWLTHGRLAA